MSVPFTNTEILIAVLFVGVVASLGLALYQELRLNRLLKGGNAQTIEDHLLSINKGIDELNGFRAEMTKYLTGVEKRLSRSITRAETIRFNPWKGTGDGGNQSFATSLIDENGDGVVISSLYSRDRMSVFAKPIEKFKAVIDLSEEEKNVLDKTSQNIKSAK